MAKSGRPKPAGRQGADRARSSGWACEIRTGNDSRSGRVTFARGHHLRRPGSARTYNRRVVFAGRTRCLAIACRMAYSAESINRAI
jgi:hypothetical protein